MNPRALRLQSAYITLTQVLSEYGNVNVRFGRDMKCAEALRQIEEHAKKEGICLHRSRQDTIIKK